tara:strand:- start:265 stop:708 length:444 start_codon:yes stop_codon:yes gene_type:complete
MLLSSNLKNNMNDKEFLFFRLNIEKISIIYGLFLVVWGLLISYISESISLTSYIPSFLGIPVLLFSCLAYKFPDKKKFFMHITATFVLIIFLGGLDVLRDIANIFDNFWADLSKLMLLLTGLTMTYLNIKSFIFARKVRKTSENREM